METCEESILTQSETHTHTHTENRDPYILLSFLCGSGERHHTLLLQCVRRRCSLVGRLLVSEGHFITEGFNRPTYIKSLAAIVGAKEAFVSGRLTEPFTDDYLPLFRNHFSNLTRPTNNAAAVQPLKDSFKNLFLLLEFIISQHSSTDMSLHHCPFSQYFTNAG